MSLTYTNYEGQLRDELAWLEDLEQQYDRAGQAMPEHLTARMLHLHNRRADLQRRAFADALAESGQKVIDIFTDARKGMAQAAYQLVMHGQVVLYARPRNIDRRRHNKRRAIAAHQARKAARS